MTSIRTRLGRSKAARNAASPAHSASRTLSRSAPCRSATRSNSSDARRQRSVRLWRQALKALERGDVEQTLRLARQRSEESAEEAARRLEPADND